MADDGTCESCPIGAECDADGTTLATLKIEPNHYRFDNTSKKVYECPKAGEHACKGGKGAAEQLCANGYTAALCSRCAPYHYRDLMTNKCVSCGSSASLVVPIIFFSILLVLAIVAALLAYNTSMQAWYATRKDRITMFRDKSTMVIVTGQIVINLQSAHRFSSGGGYPTPFDQAVASADMLVG